MPGINKAILVGNICREPELRYLPGEIAVLNFMVATTEHIFKNGTPTEHTEKHSVIMWRNLAEIAYKQLRNGQLIYVEGKFRTRCAESKENIRSYHTEIVADHFKLLGRTKDFDTSVQPVREADAAR
ncbi:single-stranded DNA-binding protein [Mucilaginibacter agri]|uniref:Single-stranded DNA-binding protein n=1 Tax=Mucilaginibacter agri TaxID=2695265 RepID=A0A966DXJ6_9SPHI|nr:single-stranded DNA-binding protein [Mucilaginibacter agri]NCD72339.1 single-stranded DNA-binding protein [Mucilaginibacter agri]